MSEERAVGPRALSENSSWNQNNSSNIVLDAKVELDSSITPRNDPPSARWHPHQVLESAISPQISQKDGSNSVSRQVSFKIEEDAAAQVSSSKQNSSKTPPPSSPAAVIKKSRTLSFLHQSSESKSNEFSEEKDLFEVEKQLKGLHRSIDASKQTQHNAFVHSKPLFLRLFTCSIITQPAYRSMDQIHNSAKTWDLFFQRRGTEFEGDVLSQDILRGIKSTLDGKYMPKSCHLKLWTHVGIVITLSAKQTTPKPSPRAPSALVSPLPLSLTAEEPSKSRRTFLSRVTPQREVKTKYLLIANERGISLRNFQEVLATCDLITKGSLPAGRYVAAYRPIRVTKLGIPQYCHMCDYLEEIARLAQAAGGFLLWRDLFIAYQHLLASVPSAPPTPSPPLPTLPLSLSTTPLTSLSFLTTFFTRLSSVSHRPSNESIAEAIRCFHLIATSHLSEADFADLSQKTKGGSGKGLFRSKSQFEVISVQSLREGLRGILRLPPTDTLAKGKDGGVGDGESKRAEGEGSRVNKESSHQLETLLTAFEADIAADGMISLDEFLTLFISLPSTSVPVEFEFPSVAMGELLAALFHAIGIFSEDYLNSCNGQPFHPQSFSSTHTTSNQGTLFRSNTSDHHSGKWTRKGKILPIGESGSGRGDGGVKGTQGLTQISACNQTPLAKRDLKKRVAVWYERDILLASS